MLPLLVSLALTFSPDPSMPLQAVGQPSSPTYEESTSVVVVEVPVRVYRGSTSLAGLGPQNFVILDNGVERPVSAFEVLKAGRGPQGIGPPAPSLGARTTRNLVLLFDLAYSSDFSLVRAVEASRRLISDQLAPGDRVAIGFFSALRGVRLVVGFTAERADLALALDTLDAMLDRDPERALERLDRISTGRRPGLLVATRDEVDREAGITLRHDSDWPDRSVIRDLAADLAELTRVTDRAPGMRGTKSILLLSHGFDPSLITGPNGASTLGNVHRGLNAFRERGVVLDTVNIGGLRSLVGRETLFHLAYETGGESFENFNDLGEAFDLLLKRTEVTYLLAFEAKDLEPPDRFRRLDVRLRDVDGRARVVHRRGYFTPGKDGE